jgi:nucleoside-diphosphate-sugar epimerase
MKKRGKLPIVVITGASGFIGRYLLDYIKNDFKIIAIARRSSTEAGVPYHPNISWVQWDIANDRMINEVMGYIYGKGGADYLVHLAAFYDFDYKDNHEYERTNIVGTKNVLELARKINVKHFLFASSLTVTSFKSSPGKITEESEADAKFHYAISKRKGEEMVRSYSNHFKCSALRFAAVFSDWCEFAPLYKFLSIWLAKKWDSRILGGKGESAISYIHIYDLTKMILSVFRKSDHLPDWGVYIGSQDGCTSHNELYNIATRDFFGERTKPVYIPRILTFPGLIAKNALAKINLLPEPFEKFWMLKYIDLKLDVDASQTRQLLDWEPTPRFHILRRMLFLLEKMKSHPNVWNLRNEAALKIVVRRANLMIYENLVIEQDTIRDKFINEIKLPGIRDQFISFLELGDTDLESIVSTIFHLLMASVRSSDRTLMVRYIDDVVLERFAKGFDANEINSFLSLFDKTITGILNDKKEMRSMKQEIYDYISLTLQMASDTVEDIYENLEHKLSRYKIADMPVLLDYRKKEELIRKLSAFYQDSGTGDVEKDTKPDPMALS